MARGELRRALQAGLALFEEEARENIREAIALYVEPADEPHVPEGGFIEEIAV